MLNTQTQTPDYYPAGILYPGGHCEGSANPHWCWVSDYSPGVYPDEVGRFEKPATSWVADSVGYRYGFNNMEKDDELKGSGNSYDFNFRVLDSRIGRFLSSDPLRRAFPFQTSYAFAANTPIWCFDLEGLEAVTRTFTYEDSHYQFTTDIQTPQEFTISVVAGDQGIQPFNFYGTRSFKYSLLLVRQQHSQELPLRSQMADVDKFDTKFYGEYITDLLIAMLEQNPDITLIVAGNHSVHIKGDLYDTYRHIKVPYLDRTIQTEQEWCIDRANFVINKLFDESDIIHATYVSNDLQRNHPNVPMKEFGKDPMGITIFFDFSNTTPDSTPEKTPKQKRKKDNKNVPKF